MKIKIFDSFLDSEDFNLLCNLTLNKTDANGLHIYHNSINNHEIIKNTCLDNKFLENLHKKYHPKALEILKELCPDKVKLYEYSEFTIIETGKNYKFSIHDDTPNKLLSGVIYLSPEKNAGTLFYDNKLGDNKREIKWLQNRGVFFSREERKSWHSYEGDNISNRIALVYNLMTNNIRDVCRVEKKNYFFVNLRLKVNPYLYKFFKITI